MGVVNRDIKLENILLKTPDMHPILKMCDFGYSINENHSLPKTALGTPGYTGNTLQALVGSQNVIHPSACSRCPMVS